MNATSNSVAPNLLDLVEFASVADVDTASALSVCSDDGPATDTRPPNISVCVDDGKPDQIEFFMCDDDGKPESVELCVCADEGNQLT